MAGGVLQLEMFELAICCCWGVWVDEDWYSSGSAPLGVRSASGEGPNSSMA